MASSLGWISGRSRWSDSWLLEDQEVQTNHWGGYEVSGQPETHLQVFVSGRESGGDRRTQGQLLGRSTAHIYRCWFVWDHTK